MSPSTSQSKWFRLTPIQWLICAVACIGFAFDTYELLVLTLTVQPALSEFLTAKPGSPIFNHWIGMLFYVPAIAGGIFVESQPLTSAFSGSDSHNPLDRCRDSAPLSSN